MSKVDLDRWLENIKSGDRQARKELLAGRNPLSAGLAPVFVKGILPGKMMRS